MITSKMGNKIINCFDGFMGKDELKSLSKSNKLICPDCGALYEYCHGNIIPPYFRHKDKTKCMGYYSESETEEHIKGKTDIYKWLVSISKECNLKNVILEHYISETKQKPDIYFEQDDKRYVIEYQCTPIASEYLERRKLYRENGIIDIWILGKLKYSGYKHIELYEHPYYNPFDGIAEFRSPSEFVDSNKIINKAIPKYPLTEVLFINGKFNFNRFMPKEMNNNNK